jgi:RimJ/RimL family protein N-acetyltransferase
MADEIRLRAAVDADLPIFFAFQLDPEANWMAAFTAKDPADRDAFMAHWTKVLQSESNVIKTLLVDGQVAGSLLHFDLFGQPAVAYWIGKAYWGRGVATKALAAFLEQIETRPLYARVAKDNIASRRVLEKCGFTITGEDRGFANARGQEIEEFILTLAANENAVCSDKLQTAQ